MHTMHTPSLLAERKYMNEWRLWRGMRKKRGRIIRPLWFKV